ncbi:hypothetical protein CAPI_02105 [Corynebacterium capitovis DSM 44611]|uniref:DUF3253 domain-containing protein n=1 Tax=Corynebacterium capitovis TaxID=131081 RepID=UPI0003640354|nr:DUF3253 domain-containing protein [Corynebacterium capitovis]WKD56995.1 hypothetical protein CAPI_02105 [Corynebacterium capitovis DSM 44611]
MTEDELGRGIVEKLDARAPESSICPSDVARELGGDAWRDLMPAVRAAAARLAERGTVVATQGHTTVDAESARGPIRIRRGPAWPE